MADKPKQNCMKCSNIEKCWATHTNTGNPVSTQNVIINILICRLQLGIDRDAAASNLLKLLRPGMIRLLSHVKQTGSITGIDFDQLLTDMQSTTIEYLLYDYKIGDRGRATPYLFDPHQGFLTKWVKWITGKTRRFYAHHELFSPQKTNDSDEDDIKQYHLLTNNRVSENGDWDSFYSDGYNPHGDDDAFSEVSTKALEIIEDGYTLNSNEYRVIKFCLVNGNETNATRHIDGLHIYLGKLMSVSRPRITRLYKRATDKIKKKYLLLSSKE